MFFAGSFPGVRFFAFERRFHLFAVRILIDHEIDRTSITAKYGTSHMLRVHRLPLNKPNMEFQKSLNDG
jgi:hypothetical protein